MNVDTIVGIITGIFIPVGIGVISSYKKLNDNTNKNIILINELENTIEKYIQETEKKFKTGFEKLDEKSDRLQKLEIKLNEYLKKVEAEQKYVQKETIKVHLENLKASDDALKNEISSLRKEIKDELKEIKDMLKKHIEEENEFIKVHK